MAEYTLPVYDTKTAADMRDERGVQSSSPVSVSGVQDKDLPASHSSAKEAKCTMDKHCQCPKCRDEFQGTAEYGSVRLNLLYAFQLLSQTDWWMGWRGSLLGSPPELTTDPSIPTACVLFSPTDGKIHMKFNYYFVRHLTAGDIAYVYAHEALHIVLDHLGRIKKYPKLWNICTDAFINEYLDHNLKWRPMVAHKDRLDWILENGIRWKDLPEEVVKKLPAESINEYSADDVYNTMLEYLLKIHEDPNNLEHECDIVKKGKPIKVKGGARNGTIKITRERVPLKEGDVVFVKSKGKYGVLKGVTRDAKGKITKVDIECDDSKSKEDYFGVALKNMKPQP